MIPNITIDDYFKCERLHVDANARAATVVSVNVEDPKEIGSIFYLRLK